MRPHNGWWRASSAPRRWIDLFREAAQAGGHPVPATAERKDAAQPALRLARRLKPA